MNPGPHLKLGFGFVQDVVKSSYLLFSLSVLATPLNKGLSFVLGQPKILFRGLV